MNKYVSAVWKSKINYANNAAEQEEGEVLTVLGEDLLSGSVVRLVFRVKTPVPLSVKLVKIF